MDVEGLLPKWECVETLLSNSILADYENHGAELEVTGALTRNLSVVASLSRLKLRDALDRRVRSVADDLASVLLNYRFTESSLIGLSLNVGASYTGERAGDATAILAKLRVSLCLRV